MREERKQKGTKRKEITIIKTRKINLQIRKELKKSAKKRQKQEKQNKMEDNMMKNRNTYKIERN